jgi:acyl-CoA thioesterase FadM
VLRHVPVVGRRFTRAKELPDVELVVSDVEVDREHLNDYDRVCGFRLRDELPPTYPHIVAFPLAMELMTDSSFPFAAMGLVHIENRIEQERELRMDEPLTVRVRAEGLEEHERGTQFQIVAEASAGEESVWHSRSTYLHKEGGGGSSGGDRDAPDVPEPNAIWKIPGDIGRRYAAVSGDRNPIHLHPLTARLFGMPAPIAHGMWMKARCLAALEGTLPESFAAQVRFKAPVKLPSRVAFASWAEDGERRFTLHEAGGGKPHLEGTVTPR